MRPVFHDCGPISWEFSMIFVLRSGIMECVILLTCLNNEFDHCRCQQYSRAGSLRRRCLLRCSSQEDTRSRLDCFFRFFLFLKLQCFEKFSLLIEYLCSRSSRRCRWLAEVWSGSFSLLEETHEGWSLVFPDPFHNDLVCRNVRVK